MAFFSQLELRKIVEKCTDGAITKEEPVAHKLAEEIIGLIETARNDAYKTGRDVDSELRAEMLEALEGMQECLGLGDTEQNAHISAIIAKAKGKS